MKESVRNYYGNEIPWHVVREHAWGPGYCTETFDLAEEVWENGEQEPQAFFDAFCAEYLERYGEEYWLNEKCPQF